MRGAAAGTAPAGDAGAGCGPTAGAVCCGPTGRGSGGDGDAAVRCGDVPGRCVPHVLSRVGAGGPIGLQAGTSSGQYQRVRIEQVHSLDTRQANPGPGTRVARRADVTRRIDDRHAGLPGGLQRRVQLGHLGRGEALFAPTVAERDHRALGQTQPKGRSDAGAGVRSALCGRIADQDLADGGIGSHRVHDFGVLHLFGVGQPRRRRTGEAIDDPQARGGQAEHAVESGEILADVGDPWRRPGRGGELHQHHALAAAIDPVMKQRLNAVGDPELARGVTLCRAQTIPGEPVRHRDPRAGRWGATECRDQNSNGCPSSQASHASRAASPCRRRRPRRHSHTLDGTKSQELGALCSHDRDLRRSPRTGRGGTEPLLEQLDRSQDRRATAVRGTRITRSDRGRRARSGRAPRSLKSLR